MPDRQLRILVADDDTDTRKILSEYLNHYGYQPLVAPDGQSALALAAIHLPDLALLDVRMPDLGGMGLAKRLWQGQPDLPVILITVENVSEDDDPWLGTPDAGVTIVEFADFECSHCAQAASTLEQVMKEYEGQVRLVFRDFPLEQLHPRAFAAAMAAECADEQGKFWEMRDLLLKHQHALSDEDLLNYGRELGLNEFDFDSCLNSKEMADEIRADQAQGASYGVYGTPTFFINGSMLTGNQPLSIWKDRIETALP